MLSRLPLLFALVIGFGLSSIVGCGGSDRELVDVQGRLTYQGKPMAGAVLGFSPTEVSMGMSQRPATAITGEDGVYRIKAFRDQFGMPPGLYRVSVLCYEGSMAEPETVRYLIPKKYSDADTSGLTAEVPAERTGALELNFEIP